VNRQDGLDDYSGLGDLGSSQSKRFKGWSRHRCYAVTTSFNSSNVIDGIAPPSGNAGLTLPSNHLSKSACESQTSVTCQPPRHGAVCVHDESFSLRIPCRIGRKPSIISWVAPGICAVSSNKAVNNG
jgi:hypothetical protein